LRNKSEVFNNLKEFKYLVENQIDNNFRVLRIDNRGELCSKDFDKFYKKCDIAHQNTTQYTPHKNRFFERVKRKLTDKERSMMSHVGLT
jgi:hypothetical protein